MANYQNIYRFEQRMILRDRQKRHIMQQLKNISSTGDVHWKRYLILCWLAQTLFQLGFSFAIPFVPFFMQTLGIHGKELSFWVALFGAAPALGTIFFSPFWGMMANRYGCKKMLLRCYIGGVVVLSGIALCRNPYWIIFFRLLQGVVCGSVPVALALVSSMVPSERTGFAMGVINSAMFSGLLFGSFFGGVAADLFGYQNAFVLSGLPSLLAAVILLFGVKEHFRPPEGQKKPVGNPLLNQWKKMTLSHWQLVLVLPILLVLGLLMFGRQFDSSFMSLFVQEINGSISGAATWTGVIQALCGVAGVLAGLSAGYLSDKFNPGKTAMVMAGLAALFMISISLTPNMVYLVIMRPLSHFVIDCIEPSVQVWLCRKVDLTARNIALAWAQSMRSTGWFIAPLVCGLVVNGFGLRALFIAASLIFLIVMVIIAVAYHRESRHEAHRKKVISNQ
ncbi:MAG: multidrug efflux MFS transporter [Lentisphaerae bacterium]|nr:multidrug efflux MFS transporter [Lentisphaerota bacterium]